LGLPSHREERSAVPGGAQEHQDGFRDELAPEAGALAQLLSGADLRPAAWDALADVLRAAVADELPAPDVVVERLADLELDDLVQDDRLRDGSQLVAPVAAEVPYTPDVGPSAARSCVAQEFAAGLAEPEPRVAQLALLESQA
jgi:hypothetical protein